MLPVGVKPAGIIESSEVRGLKRINGERWWLQVDALILSATVIYCASLGQFQLREMVGWLCCSSYRRSNKSIISTLTIPQHLRYPTVLPLWGSVVLSHHTGACIWILAVVYESSYIYCLCNTLKSWMIAHMHYLSYDHFSHIFYPVVHEH